MNRLGWPCSSSHLKALASDLESTAVGDSWLTSAAEEAPRDDMSAARRASSAPAAAAPLACAACSAGRPEAAWSCGARTDASQLHCCSRCPDRPGTLVSSASLTCSRCSPAFMELHAHPLHHRGPFFWDSFWQGAQGTESSHAIVQIMQGSGLKAGVPGGARRHLGVLSNLLGGLQQRLHLRQQVVGEPHPCRPAPHLSRHARPRDACASAAQ